MNKISYKLLFNLYVLLDHFIPQEKIVKIANDEIRCLTNEEKGIKQFINCFNYFFNNINQYFDIDVLKTSYYLLTNELLDDSIYNEIINLYYQNIDYSVHTLVSMIHLYIINNITKSNIEYAFLVSNYIMKKQQRGFLIPYKYSHFDYLNAIKNNNLSSLVRVIYDMEQIDKVKSKCILIKQDIIEKVKSIKNELITKYQVKKLYLFGSYAKGKNNESSDVDFLIVVNEELINVERFDIIDKVKVYLSNILGCDVDILDFTTAITNLGVNEVENIITLI